MIYKTNNYDIEYNLNLNLNLKNNLYFEIYHCNLYDRFKDKLLQYLSKYNTKRRTKLETKIDKKKVEDLFKSYFLTEFIAIDLLSILIFNHRFNNKFDLIFDKKSPFNIENVKKKINKQEFRTFNKHHFKTIYKIFPKLSKTYLKYFKKIKNYIKNYDNIIKNYSFNIEYKIKNNLFIMKLNIENFNEKYLKKINISNRLMTHLIKIYNNYQNKDYLSTDITDSFLIDFYCMYIRYYFFSSGNNQSSIEPILKNFLKTYFNVKIELFGSPLNTSNFIFGSFFPDVDYKFGSLGSYFNMNIKKGYFEINPVFDSVLITNVFLKSLKELIVAEKNQLPLFFCYIIPKSYFIYNKFPEELKKFIIINKLIDKKYFNFLRFSRTYKTSINEPITSIHIIIASTNFLHFYVQKNLDNFEKLFTQNINQIKKNLII